MNRKIDRRKALGALGEDLADAYLQKNGYTIVYRNFRCRLGEIDIIAERRGILTFIEVKTRVSQKYGLPAEAVTFAKQRKLRRTAECFLQRGGMLENMSSLCLDVIEIVVSKCTEVQKFRHYPHCF